MARKVTYNANDTAAIACGMTDAAEFNASKGYYFSAAAYFGYAAKAWLSRGTEPAKRNAEHCEAMQAKYLALGNTEQV